MTAEAAPEGRLSREELAFEADVPVELMDRIVAAGIFGPDRDGTFPARYVRRVLQISGLLDSGLSVGFVREILDAGLGDFNVGDQVMPHPGPRSRQTVAEFAGSLESHQELFHQVFAVLGLAEPAAERRLGIEDETMMRRFLDAFGDDPLIAVRSARLLAEGLRPAVEAMAKMQVTKLARLEADGRGQPSLITPDQAGAAREVVRTVVDMAPWLIKRYMGLAVAAANVEVFERWLAMRGLAPPQGTAHRAIVFADLTGFTALTNEIGDERAALTALRLRDEVEALTRARDGRLLHLLGDGAVLLFNRPPQAIEMAADLVRRWPTDLPGLHVGIGIGPLFERDGDYFGSTANLAARLSAVARSGQILAASVAPDPALERPGLTPIAPLTLKGFPESGPRLGGADHA